MKKRVVLGVFVFCLGMTSLDTASAQTATSKKEVINLFLGSVSSSSGIYAFAVSLSNVIRKYDPGVIMWQSRGLGHPRLPAVWAASGYRSALG
jgi:hypothetical protein